MHEPILHVMDSNATAFNARGMRDEPTPTMDGESEARTWQLKRGLREIEGNWKQQREENRRAPWNQQQKVNLERIVKEMQEWDQPKWPKKYRDQNIHHPIMSVGSHQLDDRGKLTGKRYKVAVFLFFLGGGDGSYLSCGRCS